MPINTDLTAVLKRLGYDSFRPHQEEIVRSLLEGRDVCAVMPTGGGKSLCYMLPAACMPGLTLVVTPLISLMQDQVRSATARGIRAACLSSTMAATECFEVYRVLRSGDLRLLYVAPERLDTKLFQSLLRQCHVTTVVVDEAHCVYEYGAEFRPSYRRIAAAVKPWRNDGVPIGAFTGTATRKTEQIICEYLGLRDPFHVRASFNRPNLFYEVRSKTDPLLGQLVSYITLAEGSGIVYRATRDLVNGTASYLQRHNVAAVAYHAGLSPAARMSAQNGWMGGESRVVVATVAFGMGVDKPDCRWVVHADLPKSMEGYYQETGRAGRDGEPAHCLMLWDYGDIPEARRQCETMEDPQARAESLARLQEIVNYVQQSTECRRTTTLRYFDEKYPGNCGACDVCCAAGAVTGTRA